MKLELVEIERKSTTIAQEPGVFWTHHQTAEKPEDQSNPFVVNFYR